jgi:hypothetical protein
VPRIFTLVSVISLISIGSADAQLVTAVRAGSIDVAGLGEIRLIGVEPASTASIHAALCARELTALASSLVEGRVVKVMTDASIEANTAAQPFRLRYVYLPDGTLLNEVLLETGCTRLAHASYSPHLWSRLERANASAQANGKGLYGPADAKPQVPYVVTVATEARAEPRPNAAVVRTMKPFDMLIVEDAQPGWVCGLLAVTSAATSMERACLEADADNLLPRDWHDALRALHVVAGAPWPTKTKMDVLKRRVRIGFLPEHTRLALGDPLRVTESETASGVREVWLYPGRIITFVDGKVSEVVTQK